MKPLILFLALIQVASAAEPLRVFIRSGEKTHRPGCHDYPAFLKDWTALLNERGAKATGGNEFPTKEQLAETDVVILHAEEAGNIKGDDRANFEAYLKRGGGVVAIHGGTVSRDPDWYKTIIGGSWNFDHTKFLEDHLSLYFTDRENPITEGASNFDMEDEIYYDMDLMPDAKVLAAAYTPKPKKAAEAAGKAVNIYDIQPQIWTYETGNRRAFACIPGHVYENFSHISLQTILLRGIAWAGKMEDADAFLKDKPATESALRYPVGGPTRPDDAAAKIEVHPEFDISLVAAEPLINKVLNVDWDENGRMWVVESPEYPNGLRKVNTDAWKDSGSVKPGIYDREPLDRISILTDSDGDGRMDQKKVFADKLELATSFVFHENGVIVSAAPDIWFLEDTDGDEVADKRTKLYTGLGNGDTHAVMNNLRWGLDGWVYATHGYSAGNVKCLGAPDKPAVGIGSGVIRFKPDGTEIEQYASRRGNTWGLCMTTDGQCFWTQPTSGTVFFHTVLPEHVLAKGKIPGTESYHGMVVSQKTFPLMQWEQAAYKQIDWVGSYTAAAGCAVYEGGAWPEKWNRSYFVGEPTINIVSHYFVKPDGITYTTEKEKGREETEFIRSKDLWFRPVETRIGPDGALYLVDFYNQAVIHNDTRGPQHGPATAAVRPDRDHYFGRIWRIQHKEAKKIQVPQIDRKNPGSLSAALRSPNAHTRMTAMRLMREEGQAPGIETGSAALKAYRSASAGSVGELIAAFSNAEDKWTQSALIAAARKQAMEVITDCLSSQDPEALIPLAVNLLPAAMEGDSSAALAKLIVVLAFASSTADPMKAAIIDAIADEKSAKPPLSPELSEALVKLVGNPATAPKVLPLVVRWDKDGTMAALVAEQAEAMSKKLDDPKAALEDRVEAARVLVSLGTKNSIGAVLWVLQNGREPVPLKIEIVTALGASEHSVELATKFEKLDKGIHSLAFDEIVKRPAAAMAFLDKVDAAGSGAIDPKDIGPGNVARLMQHPDKAVAARAKALSAKLMPGAKARDEIVTAFIPVVTKPGDVANGKNLFHAACAVCHMFGDNNGADVGPGLTGMGMHAPEELLVHIVDPNREVDPSYWQWNITTKRGETLSGVVTTENRASLTLRNQAGDTEIQKADIASRVNTRRSLMPEGLDGLGAEGIRDIIAYMSVTDRAADERIKALPADSTSETGMRFAEPKRKGGLRVLIVGAGSSHHFPRDFVVGDRATLSVIPSADVIGTMNLAEALENMPKADVLVFSGNHNQWGTPEFQKALHTFADAGKGIVLLHAATWSHPWEGYNKRFVAGETKGHGKGEVAADCIRPANHPVLKGVPESFTIEDESYHFAFFEKEGHTTLIENKPDGKGKATHPALWIVKDPKTRIVAYTHGHDEKSHANPAYQTILCNAVKWVSSK
jgi:putative membrane-bound dehydrogenase-like protein